MALKKHAQELKRAWKARHASQKTRISAEIESLHNQVQMKAQEIETALQRISTVEKDKRNLVLRLKKLDEETNEKVAKAAQYGEDEGRRKTIDDINASMEGELSALRRTHLEQLNRARLESYKQGFDASQKGAPLLTSRGDEARDRNEQTSSNVQMPDKKERISAFEQGKREGREMAYQELALSSDDRVNIVLRNHSELNKNRKV